MPFNLKIEDKYNKFNNIKLVPLDISNYDQSDLSHNNIEYISAFNWYKPNMNDNDNISDFKNSDTEIGSSSSLYSNNSECERDNCYSYDPNIEKNEKSYKYFSHRNSLCPYSCKLC